MLIRVEALDFAYPGGAELALAGLSLTLPAGQAAALVGENGSGKSTLARQLNGLLRPRVGAVWVGDWRTSDHSPAQLARRVAYVFQNPDEQLFSQRVWDEVAFGPRNLGFPAAEVRRRVERALAWTGLMGVERVNPRDLGYSGRKQVALASALALDTPVLVLDEPTAGLDAQEQARLAEIIQALRRAQKTVLLITHDLDFAAENVERFILLRHGRVALDAPTAAFFEQSAELDRAGLIAPQITRLSQSLGRRPLAHSAPDFWR